MPSHPFTIPFLYFLCSGAYLSLGLRLPEGSWPEGSWPCYKSERTTRDLWFMGDHPRFPTRAETWVFPHNPRPLVFFLLHTLGYVFVVWTAHRERPITLHFSRPLIGGRQATVVRRHKGCHMAYTGANW